MWWKVKKDYRDRYLYKRMRKHVPNWIRSEAVHTAIIDAKLLAFMRGSVPGYSNTLQAYVALPGIDELAAKFLSDTYGKKYDGRNTVKDFSNPDEKITYIVRKKHFVSLYGKKPHNPNVVQGRTNTNKFFVGMSGTAVDSKGQVVVDANGNPKVYKKPHNNIPNKYKKESIVVFGNVSGVVRVYIYELSKMKAYVKTEKIDMVPVLPIQVLGKRPPKGKILDEMEWFLDRLNIPLRGDKTGEDGLYDLLDKVDKDNDSSKHKKQVDFAYIITSVEPHDPYIYDKCGWIKTEDVQNFPLKIMKRATPNRKVDPTKWEIKCGPANVPGSIAWWKKRNRFRRNRYARLFYELIELYGSGSTTINTATMPNTVRI